MPRRTIKGHQILNVVGRVTCLDRERTVSTLIDPDKDVILRMKKLAVDATRARALPFFRLDELELLVLISKTTRDALHRLRGVSLLPAQARATASGSDPPAGGGEGYRGKERQLDRASRRTAPPMPQGCLEAYAAVGRKDRVPAPRHEETTINSSGRAANHYQPHLTPPKPKYATSPRLNRGPCLATRAARAQPSVAWPRNHFARRSPPAPSAPLQQQLRQTAASKRENAIHESR